jgi:hypothetical protein
MLLRDVEPALIVRHMALFATLILLAATAVLEGDVLQRLPPASAVHFYAMLVLNCSLAIASNFLNMLVTKANGALSLQVWAALKYSHRWDIVCLLRRWQRPETTDGPGGFSRCAAGIWQPVWRPGNGVLCCGLPQSSVVGWPQRLQLDNLWGAALHEGEVRQRFCGTSASPQTCGGWC